MNFLLVDLSGIFRAHWHASENAEVSEAFHRTVSQVAKYREGFDRVAICCDAPPYKRKEILPDYKAQRDSPPPQLIGQLDATKERLAADGCTVYEAAGYEADDIIATLARQIAERKAFDTAVIVSSDKDLLQLVTDDVTVLSPMSGKTYNRAAVIEKFGVAPEDMGDFLALWGDAADNVPGIPGVGEKTAAKLIIEWGSLEGVLTHWSDMKGVMSEKIRDHGPAARLGRRVIQLDANAPVELEAMLGEPEVKPVAPTKENYETGDDEAAMAVPSQAPATTALATIPTNFDMALEPATLSAAWGLAKGIFNSRLYTKFKNAEAVWIAIIRGRELGLGAATSLDVIHIVEGKPCMSAHLIIDRAKRHPDCEYFRLIESDDTTAVYETKARSNPTPTRHSYTIEEAQRAGVAPQNLRATPAWEQRGDRRVDVRSNWEKRPAEMLRKTCGTQLTRIEYPGAALGLYAIEELSGD